MRCARLLWIGVVAGCPADDGGGTGTTGDSGASTATGDTGGVTTSGAMSSSASMTGGSSEASTDASETSTAEGSSSSSETTAATTGPIECGVDPKPPGGECPAACTGGCVADICMIACSGEQSCVDMTLACPEGFACDVACMGYETCLGSTVVCPTMHACTVECIGLSSCPTQIQCGNASCTVQCELADPCTDTTVDCGPGSCTATCQDPLQAQPTVNCGDACECQAC